MDFLDSFRPIGVRHRPSLLALLDCQPIPASGRTSRQVRLEYQCYAPYDRWLAPELDRSDELTDEIWTRRPRPHALLRPQRIQLQKEPQDLQ